MSEEFKQPERTKRYDPAADPDGKTMVGFRVERKRWSQVKALFAELGQSDTALLMALKIGHGIEFDSLRQDPFLHFIISQDQTEGLERAGVPSPTWLQLLGSSEVVSLTHDGAVARFKALKENQ